MKIDLTKEEWEWIYDYINISFMMNEAYPKLKVNRERFRIASAIHKKLGDNWRDYE